MSSKKTKVTHISSVVVDDRLEFSLEELCRSCQVDQTVITEYVEQGIVEPSGRNTRSWRFSGAVLPRLTRALRLQKDLELNTAGVAFALDLLGEIESLRKRLNRFQTEEEFNNE